MGNGKLKSSFLRSIVCSEEFENDAYASGATRIAGVDEVGCGCLFGPVTAAAVILPRGSQIDDLQDSKLISSGKRKRLADQIKRTAVAWHIADVPSSVIDAVGIGVASLMAMEEAVHGLSILPDFLLIDSVSLDDLALPQRSPVHGDAYSVSIAAASIIAKVHRDDLCEELEKAYPGYGIARHKGYGTAAHLEALNRLGASLLHRRSFSPVRSVQSANIVAARGHA